MQNIRVNKLRLREALLANRKLHQAVFEEAFENYRKAAIRSLEENLGRLKSGSVHSRIVFREIVPESHVTDYDQALRMLDYFVDDEIEMSGSDFRTLLLDEWGWRRKWIADNDGYLSETTKVGYAVPAPSSIGGEWGSPL